MLPPMVARLVPSGTQRSRPPRPVVVVIALVAVAFLVSSDQSLGAGGNLHDSRPAWSPDGARIAYQHRNAGSFNIWVMNADGSNKAQCTTESTDEQRPYWTATGDGILYQSNALGDFNIYRISYQAGIGCTGSPVVLSKSPARDVEPEMAPDGSAIAFVSNRDGALEVYLMDVDGKNVRSCSQDPHSDHTPGWSFDSTKIAFHSHRLLFPKKGNGEIWTMDVIGGQCLNPVRLTFNDQLDEDPTWSPDGKAIAFHRKAEVGGFDIIKLNLTTMQETNLTSNPADDMNPAWSPDGTRIAFTSDRAGGLDVWVMNADGTNPQNLTPP